MIKYFFLGLLESIFKFFLSTMLSGRIFDEFHAVKVISEVIKFWGYFETICMVLFTLEIRGHFSHVLRPFLNARNYVL